MCNMLASNAPNQDRLKALKYLVHFVEDVHQPFHAGYGNDRGGNKFQLQAFSRGTPGQMIGSPCEASSMRINQRKVD